MTFSIFKNIAFIMGALLIGSPALASTTQACPDLTKVVVNGKWTVPSGWQLAIGTASTAVTNAEFNWALVTVDTTSGSNIKNVALIICNYSGTSSASAQFSVKQSAPSQLLTVSSSLGWSYYMKAGSYMYYACPSAANSSSVPTTTCKLSTTSSF